MQAVLCKQYGPPDKLVLETVPSLPVADNEVRIGVSACGVNFPDTLIIQGLYQFKPDLPFSPGGEVAGEVIEVGDSVSRFKVGDSVMAMNYYGGFAEEFVVPEAGVMAIPEGMSHVTAAAFTLVYGTAYHALKQRADIQPGETLLVLGAAGGVGLAAVELGKQMGARVIAAAGSDEKLAICRDYGAEHTINYRREQSLREQVKALMGGRGVDVVFDPVGGDLFEEALRSMSWQGRLLVIGFASGSIPKMPVNLPLLKGCEVVGVFWGLFREKQPQVDAENFAQLFEWYQQGLIKPLISKTYPLAQAAEALNALLQRKAVGKLVLVTDR